MRRAFLKGLALGSVAWREALAAEAPGERARQVAALEVFRVEGRREVREAHRQHQANPAHVWDPPPEYHEPDDAPLRVVPTSAIYVKARTQGGTEAVYGPIEHECVPVLVRDLAPFLVGRDPLAVETLWDRMHRSNRHSRAGHFMMAISAADNVLWDLRGRLLGLPVFRLLGGSRDRVPVYASCLGFSLEPGKAERAPSRPRAGGRRSGSSPTARRRGARAS
jgi:L-rhamnonate dehydratase